ncbi:cytochrome c, partial [Burkholderia cenocepacia]|nr:cytochrome c [Burkholderia cenocepacia]
MLKRQWFSLVLLTVCLLGQRASAQSTLELDTDGTARA